MIDRTLADEDATPKVVNVTADMENDIGESVCNSFMAADSLTAAFSQFRSELIGQSLELCGHSLK